MNEKLKCRKCGHEEYETIQMPGKIKAVCKKCKTYIKFLPIDEYPKIHLGKYKGQEIRSIEDADYLKWVLTTKQSKRAQDAIRNRINELR